MRSQRLRRLHYKKDLTAETAEAAEETSKCPKIKTSKLLTPRIPKLSPSLRDLRVLCGSVNLATKAPRHEEVGSKESCQRSAISLFHSQFSIAHLCVLRVLRGSICSFSVLRTSPGASLLSPDKPETSPAASLLSPGKPGTSPDDAEASPDDSETSPDGSETSPDDPGTSPAASLLSPRAVLRSEDS